MTSIMLGLREATELKVQVALLRHRLQTARWFTHRVVEESEIEAVFLRVGDKNDEAFIAAAVGIAALGARVELVMPLAVTVQARGEYPSTGIAPDNVLDAIARCEAESLVGMRYAGIKFFLDVPTPGEVNTERMPLGRGYLVPLTPPRARGVTAWFPPESIAALCELLEDLEPSEPVELAATEMGLVVGQGKARSIQSGVTTQGVASAKLPVRALGAALQVLGGFADGGKVVLSMAAGEPVAALGGGNVYVLMQKMG